MAMVVSVMMMRAKRRMGGKLKVSRALLSLIIIEFKRISVVQVAIFGIQSGIFENVLVLVPVVVLFENMTIARCARVFNR